MGVQWIQPSRFEVAGTFDPLTLSPALWFDASDGASITSSGGAVSQWNDKSGNALHLTDVTTAPTTGATSRNGNNVLDFDGSQIIYRTAGVVFAQPISIFTVAVFANTDTANRGALRNFSNAPSWGTVGGNWQQYAGGSYDTGVADDGNWHVFGNVFDGASSAFRVDGANVATINSGSNGYTDGGFGVGGTPGFGWIGSIAEVLVFSGTLGTTDRDNVEDYLATKWGTP